jgi:hypothetical protein
MTAEQGAVWPSTAEVDAWAEAFTAPARAERLLRRLRRRRPKHAAAGKAAPAQAASTERSAA